MRNQEENASAYPELIDKGISFVDELNYLINHKMENEIDSLKRNMQSMASFLESMTLIMATVINQLDDPQSKELMYSLISKVHTLYVSDRQHDFFHEELWEQIHLIIARANDRNAD